VGKLKHETGAQSRESGQFRQQWRSNFVIGGEVKGKRVADSSRLGYFTFVSFSADGRLD
jgi:hypothetical protein